MIIVIVASRPPDKLDIMNDLEMKRLLNNREQVQTRTRRVLFIAGPGTEILDLVGPLQVFVRAAEMFSRQNPGSPPIYSVEVITTSRQTSVVTNCGLRIAAHNPV